MSTIKPDTEILITLVVTMCRLSVPDELQVPAEQLGLSSSQIPTEQMVFHQHVTNTVFEWLRRLFLQRQLPVGVQVEGELRQYPQLTLDLHPAGAAHETPRIVPDNMLQHFITNLVWSCSNGLGGMPRLVKEEDIINV